MMDIPKVFVANVGLKSITICGSENKIFLSKQNSRVVRDSVIVDFPDEDKLINFIQDLINDAIPFESTYKSQAFRTVNLFKEKGLVHGEIISFG